MPRTPHSRTRPPAPKERPSSLAISGVPRLAPLAPSGRPETNGGGGDMIGLWAFAVLIALGLMAAARAFLAM